MVVWSESAGLNARLMNTRGDLGWDVPMVGHPAMGTGNVKSLLKKPENWNKVYIVGYRELQLRRRRQAAGAHAAVPRQSGRQGDAVRHHALVGRLRLRFRPAHQIRGRAPARRSRTRSAAPGSRRILSRHLRRLQLHGDRPQRLPDQRSGHERGELVPQTAPTRWRRATTEPCSHRSWRPASPSVPSTR